MPAANKALIPPKLRRKVSPGLLVAVDERRAIQGLGIGLAALGLYGPITVHADHNGFLYLLGPWICPSVFAIFWVSIPHRPYRGQFYDKTMHDVDTNDPSVMRLVELFRSDEARRQLWHESLKLSAILFTILGTAAFLLRDSLHWNLPSGPNRFLSTRGQWFWVGIILCFIGSFLSLGSSYSGWCLTTWAIREAAYRAVKE
jgi:hypothetical protein